MHALVALSLTLCASLSLLAAEARVSPEGPSLRQLAELRHVEIGANFPSLVYGKPPNSWATSPTAPVEQAIAAEQFTIMSAGWEMYPGRSWTGPSEYDLAGAQVFVDWCLKRGIKVHGHGLGYGCRVEWFQKLPTHTPEERAQVRDVYERYPRDTAGRFAGRIHVWDLCNEQLLPAYVFSGFQTRHSYWKAYQTSPGDAESGIEWYRRTFRVAHETDPLARLVLLEFNNEVLCPKSDRLYALVKQLREEGVPVHGVGFQMHLHTDLNRSKGHGLKTDEDYFASLQANLRRFGELGLELWITELDVGIDPAQDLTSELERQAVIYQRVTQIALGAPGLAGIKFWGIVDGDTWGGVNPRRPNLFDETGRPKPAFYAVQRSLQAI